MTRFTTPLVALVGCLLLFSAAASVPAKDELPPPGLVLISGGRTKVGTDLKELKKLLEDNAQLQKNAGGFLAEVPQHKVAVSAFYLMATEVTNEQYREFVMADKARPPLLWGGEAIDAARQAFLKTEGEKRKKAKEEGRQAPARVKFEEADWWQQNWQDAEWEMPEKMAHMPVVYIDYQDARRYAQWAGLRIPDENEFERAARGDSDRIYPWGDEFVVKKHAATQEISGVSEVFAVGSFPAGATREGVIDLAGNAWEWTSSPYTAYPKWKHKEFTLGRGRSEKTIDSIPAFSPDRRVVKSGSIQNSRFFARVTTRGGFDRFQRASALSFRCAASTKLGYDFAVSSLADIPNQARPQTAEGPVNYDPNQVIAMDRWQTAESTCEVPGYAVIKSYDFILFTPAESIPTTGVSDITKAAKDDQVFHLGFLVTSRDIVEPALPAGTYLVALRGKGEAQKDEEEEKPEGEDGAAPVEKPADDVPAVISDLAEALEFDPSVANFIMYDMTGAPVIAIPVENLKYSNPAQSQLEVVERTILVPGATEDDDPVELSQTWLDMKLFVKGKSRKGIKATLSLRFAEGLLEGNWR